MLRDRRILITGASGFIGSHIVERLQRDAADVEIHALARDMGKLNELPRHGGFTFHSCDLLDADHLSSVVANIRPHVVIHLASSPDAAQSSVHARSSVANNVVATINLLDSVSDGGHINSFVYGDSTKVYGPAPAPYSSRTPLAPNSAYSITKMAGWEFVKLYAERGRFGAVALRPTLIYGPRQSTNLISNLLKAIQERQPVFTLQGGSQTRAPLHVEDAVDAFLIAAETAHSLNGRVINIGGAEELSVAEIAHTVVRCAEAPMRVHHEGPMRDADVLRSSVDLSEAEDLLGWSPSISLTEGLRSILNAYPAEV